MMFFHVYYIELIQNNILFGALIDEGDMMIQPNFLSQNRYASLVYSSKII